MVNTVVVWRTSGVAGFLTLLAIVAAISNAAEPARPGATAASGATLSGTVQLTANLYDERGKVTGQQVVSHADGVRVQLRRPGGGIDSTLTSQGRYSFAGGARGTYQVSCSVVAKHDVTSKVDVGAGASAVVPEMNLGPVGEVRTYPNPFGATGLSIEYEAATEQQTEVVVHALSGEVVWKYSPGPVKGLNHIHWMGTNMEHAALPAGAYWVVVHKEGGHHYNLVFKP